MIASVTAFCGVRRPRLTPFSILTFLILTSHLLFGADFNAGWRLQYDDGKEVNPQSPAAFPDNRSDRNYFEGLLTAELLFASPPLGDNLRLGIRFLEFQPSGAGEDRCEGSRFPDQGLVFRHGRLEVVQNW